MAMDNTSLDTNNIPEELAENCCNAGWADSIAKILQTSKPKSKKTLVLSRAKNLNKQTEKSIKPKLTFEIDGEVHDETHEIKLEKNLKEIKIRKNDLRIKPSLQDRERERVLKRIATGGVVQLFNTVRMQQKDLEIELEKAGPLDSRQDAVLNNINKKKFLDVLMSGNRSKSELIDNPVKDESSSGDEDDESDSGSKKKKTEWSVLQDNFMTSKKFRNWDEDSDENLKQNNDETSDTD